MHNTIIIRYSEIALKGGNRILFEKRLIRNIKDCLKKNNKEHEKILRKRGRIIIFTDQFCPELAFIFGISSFSYAVQIPYDIDQIKKNISILIKEKPTFKKFRISSKRIDKSIESINSQDLNINLGSYVCTNFNKQVSLKEYDVNIGIEILEKQAYIFFEDFVGFRGPEGLPLGINGDTFALIESQKSVLAAWYVMKRGLRIFPIIFKGSKYTDIHLLEKYNYGAKQLNLIQFKSLDELMGLMNEHDIFSIITDDTLNNFNHMIQKLETKVLILRPLVGLSDTEIIGKYKKL